MFKVVTLVDYREVRSYYSIKYDKFNPLKLPIYRRKFQLLNDKVLFFELNQLTNRSYNVTFFFSKSNKLTFINGKHFDAVTNSEVTFSSFIIFFKLIKSLRCFNFLFNVFNVNFLPHYNKILILVFEELNLLNFKYARIIFSKPNFFYLYFQKTKIKSIKKSRKKLLYLQKSKIRVL